jgi:nucleoside-diphosphate-sugar epimerase
MNVAVTGGSGQLGTLVLRRLVDDRRVKRIVSIDLRPPLLVAGKLHPVESDVRAPDLSRHLEGCDALVHLAFVVTRYERREVMDDINIEGSKNVFRAAAAAGCKRIVYSSSVAAYGVLPGHPVPIVEDTPRRYQDDFAYAATKYRVEEFLDGFEREHAHLAVVRLRPSILIGQRMDHGLGDALRRRVVPSTGDAPLPIVWDEDVADAILLALHQDVRGAFNLSADHPLPMEALASSVGMRVVHVHKRLAVPLVRAARVLNRVGIGRALDPAWVRNTATLIQSSERAKRELGWKPRCPDAIDVIRRFVEVVPRRMDPRLVAFFGMLALAARYGPPVRELAGFRSRIHLCLTGEGGGDVGLIVADNRVQIRFTPPRPPDAVVTLRASLFLDMLAGRGDFGLAQLTGKVRLEGQGHAMMIVGGLVGTFRARIKAEGVDGAIGRALARFIERTDAERKDAT